MDCAVCNKRLKNSESLEYILKDNSIRDDFMVQVDCFKCKSSYMLERGPKSIVRIKVEKRFKEKYISIYVNFYLNELIILYAKNKKCKLKQCVQLNITNKVKKLLEVSNIDELFIVAHNYIIMS